MKWSKLFKVAGSALLLIAFGMQMYQTRAAAVETRRQQAAELDAPCHMKSLEYENLYMAIKTATGEDDPFNLFAAAQQRALGRVTVVVTSGQPKEVIAARIQTIWRAASTVRDLASFNAFMNRFRDEQDSQKANELSSLVESGKIANSLWWTYIVLYVVGSASVLWSQILEK